MILGFVGFIGCIVVSILALGVAFTGFHSTSKKFKYTYKSEEKTLNLNIEDLKLIMTNDTNYRHFLPPVVSDHIKHLEGQHFSVHFPILGEKLTTLWMNPKLLNEDKKKKIIYRLDNEYLNGHFLYTLKEIGEKKTRYQLEVEYKGKYNIVKTGMRILQSVLNNYCHVSIEILENYSEFMWKRIEKMREGYVDDEKNTGKDLKEGEFEILDDGISDM